MLDSIGLARHQVLRIAFLLIAKNFVRLNWKAQFLFCKDHGSTGQILFIKLQFRSKYGFHIVQGKLTWISGNQIWAIFDWLKRKNQSSSPIVKVCSAEGRVEVILKRRLQKRVQKLVWEIKRYRRLGPITSRLTNWEGLLTQRTWKNLQRFWKSICKAKSQRIGARSKVRRERMVPLRK